MGQETQLEKTKQGLGLQGGKETYTRKRLHTWMHFHQHLLRLKCRFDRILCTCFNGFNTSMEWHNGHPGSVESVACRLHPQQEGWNWWNILAFMMDMMESRALQSAQCSSAFIWCAMYGVGKPQGVCFWIYWIYQAHWLVLGFSWVDNLAVLFCGRERPKTYIVCYAGQCKPCEWQDI